MSQPAFTFWPWKVLAVCMPLLAGLSVWMGYQEDQDREQLTAIFFAVLNAGNGYMLAAAIGDFGRSIIAIPVGAGAAFICVAAVQFPLFRVFAVVLLGGTLVVRSLEKFSESPGSVGLFSFLLLLVTLGAVPAAWSAANGSLFGMLMIYPLITGCVTVCMPAENTTAGRRAALTTGWLAAIFGMGGGFAVGLISAVVVSPIFTGSRAMGPRVILISLIACTINYICIRMLLGAAIRISVAGRESVAEVASAATVSDLETPAPKPALPMAEAAPAGSPAPAVTAVDG